MERAHDDLGEAQALVRGWSKIGRREAEGGHGANSW
jgi:hypothetical protein